MSGGGVVVSIDLPSGRVDIDAVPVDETWCVHRSHDVDGVIIVTHRAAGLAALKLDFGPLAPADTLSRVVAAAKRARPVAGYVPEPETSTASKRVKAWTKRIADSFGCRRGDGCYFRVPGAAVRS